jgi:hypothetical protein
VDRESLTVYARESEKVIREAVNQEYHSRAAALTIPVAHIFS